MYFFDAGHHDILIDIKLNINPNKSENKCATSEYNATLFDMNAPISSNIKNTTVKIIIIINFLTIILFIWLSFSNSVYQNIVKIYFLF